VGAGFSGLGMGVELKEAGIEDFVIFEKEDEVGGLKILQSLEVRDGGAAQRTQGEHGVRGLVS